MGAIEFNWGQSTIKQIQRQHVPIFSWFNQAALIDLSAYGVVFSLSEKALKTQLLSLRKWSGLCNA